MKKSILLKTLVALPLLATPLFASAGNEGGMSAAQVKELREILGAQPGDDLVHFASELRNLGRKLGVGREENLSLIIHSYTNEGMSWSEVKELENKFKHHVMMDPHATDVQKAHVAGAMNLNEVVNAYFMGH